MASASAPAGKDELLPQPLADFLRTAQALFAGRLYSPNGRDVHISSATRPIDGNLIEALQLHAQMLSATDPVKRMINEWGTKELQNLAPPDASVAPQPHAAAAATADRAKRVAGNWAGAATGALAAPPAAAMAGITPAQEAAHQAAMETVIRELPPDLLPQMFLNIGADGSIDAVKFSRVTNPQFLALSVLRQDTGTEVLCSATAERQVVLPGYMTYTSPEGHALDFDRTYEEKKILLGGLSSALFDVDPKNDYVLNAAGHWTPDHRQGLANIHNVPKDRYLAFQLEDDNKKPDSLTPAMLDMGADFINRAIQQGKRVVVHCAEGKSRSFSFVVAYYIKHKGMTYDEAFKHVQSTHPLRVEKVGAAIHAAGGNEMFNRVLRQFATQPGRG